MSSLGWRAPGLVPVWRTPGRWSDVYHERRHGFTQTLGTAVATRRCVVHKLRNLLAKAPVRQGEELAEDYRRMIYGATRQAVEKASTAFVKKWRLRCPPVVTSFEEAGDELFTFLRFPPAQRKALRTTNAFERINEEFRRRTKTQALLLSADAVLLLLFGVLRSGL